ncbi:transposase [Cohnella sp. 56]|uniref:transposase n=1 Tax=Cohnella sp. 56 TaxID=3113722 RepID=UPI0030E8CAC1
MKSALTSPSTEATVYHYKLVRKIPMRPETKYSYMTTALLGAGFVTGFYTWTGLQYVALGLLVMIFIHAVVLRITLRRVDAAAGKRWSFRIDWPWIGPLPVMDTSLRLFRRLHYHLILVGCCATALLYPWAHPAFLVSLFYWHFWLLSPRLTLLLRMRKERGDGVLRLSETEVSYYHI